MIWPLVMQVLEFTCALIFRLSQITNIYHSPEKKKKPWHEIESLKERLKKKGQFLYLKSVCQEGAMFEGHLSDLITSLWVNLWAGLFEMFNERMMVIGALIGCSSILLLVFSVSEKGWKLVKRACFPCFVLTAGVTPVSNWFSWRDKHCPLTWLTVLLKTKAWPLTCPALAFNTLYMYQYLTKKYYFQKRKTALFI